MKAILAILFLCYAAQAETITFTQDQQHSRIVVIDGREMILLPSGRIIPTGQSQICAEQACGHVESSAAIDNTSRRRWVVPVLIGAGIITTLLLLPCDKPSIIVPPTIPNIPTSPPQPPVSIPEPTALLLLGSGLLFIASRLKGKST